MMRSLWISKTGMEAQQTQLDTISNNLANVSTNGYKRAHAVFEDLMYQNLRQAGANLVVSGNVDPLLWDDRLEELMNESRRRDARVPAQFLVWPGPSDTLWKGDALNLSVIA